MFYTIYESHLKWWEPSEALQLCRKAFLEAYDLYDDQIRIGSFRNWAWVVCQRKAVTAIIFNNTKQAKFDNSHLSINKPVHPSSRSSNNTMTLADIVADPNVKPPYSDLVDADVRGTILSLINAYMADGYNKTEKSKNLLIDYYVYGCDPKHLHKHYGKRWDNRLRNFRLFVFRYLKRKNIKITRNFMDFDLIDKMNISKKKGKHWTWVNEQSSYRRKERGTSTWKII